MNDRNANLRVTPHSIPAEQAVLGGVMLMPEALHEVRDLLTVEDFYTASHRALYQGMCHLSDSSQPIDVVTVMEHVGSIDPDFDGAYAVELATTTPSAANVKAYAQIVRNKALLRRVIATSTEIAEDAYGSTDDDADQVVSGAAAKMAALTVSASGQGGLVMLSSGLKTAWEELEGRFHGDRAPGLALPWSSTYGKLSGLDPTDLVILAARPAMGKTAMALQMAEHAAVTTGRGVAVFSMEMSKTQLSTRFISARSGVEQWKIKNPKGNLSNDDWAKITQARRELNSLPIAIDDDSSLSAEALTARASRMAAKYPGGLAMVVVDYLQLLEGKSSGRGRNESRADEVSRISRQLKKLAGTLNCPVIALSQLNRSVESRNDKRPVMSDIRESGSIEQDADVIVFIYRDDYYTKDACGAPGIAELIIGKNRHGQTGTCYLQSDLGISTFHDYTGPKPDYTPRHSKASEAGDGGFDDPTPRRSRKRASWENHDD